MIEIAKTDKDWQVRWKAVKGIKDKKVLMEIARKDKDEPVRRAAAERVIEIKNIKGK